MELSQIKGANLLVTGDFFPRPPQVGRESETANKTTIAIFKVVSVAEGGVLYFIHPTTKEMIVCSPIDAGSVSYELNERDATNPFRVLVAYNYITKQIVVTQGTPAADPVTPELGANQLFIAAFTEQAIGTQQEEPPAPVQVAFTYKSVAKSAGTYTDIIDFQYNHVYLYLNGNVTISDTIDNLIGDSFPDGKELFLFVISSSGERTLTFGNNFKLCNDSQNIPINTTFKILRITKNVTNNQYIVDFSQDFYFRYKEVTKGTGTYTDIIDFQYSEIYLTLTGNITISNTIDNLTGLSLPNGKNLVLYVKGSANTLSWGTNYVITDNSLDLSTSTSKWNRLIIHKNMNSGKFEVTNTETITA